MRLALRIHIFLSLIFAALYSTIRYHFGKNFRDLPSPSYRVSRTTEFSSKGCKMLFFKPVEKSKRRILLFPGLGISVRRMLEQPCMQPFVDDSEIVCFQIRGIGESCWDVDIASDSMLEDALHAATVFDQLTDGNLKTLFVGYSLGCFVSMQLLSHIWTTNTKCDNILLVNGMYDSQNMIQQYKIMSMLLGVVVQPHVKKSSVPITILHAKDDETIFLQEAIDLQNECMSIGRSCHLFICDGTHSHYSLTEQTFSALKTNL